MLRSHLPLGAASAASSPFLALFLGFMMQAPPAQAEPDSIHAPVQIREAIDTVFAAQSCKALPVLTDLGAPINRTVRLLSTRQPVKIVAIGSSSTAGAGASSPAYSYPSRLAAELSREFPDSPITVANEGRNGEEIPAMLARLGTDVLARKPDLVLWQLGANTVLRNQPVQPNAALMEQGIDMIRQAGADVILVDPQYAPQMINKAGAPEMLDLIALVAKQAHVAVVRRFDLMKDWHEKQAIPFDTFVMPDGIHMNDWGYSCFARLLRHGIAEAVNRSQSVAKAQIPRAAASPQASPAAPPREIGLTP